MSIVQNAPRFSGFIRLLVESQYISASDMLAALEASRKNHQDIVAYLVEQAGLSALVIANAIAQDFGEALFDLNAYEPSLLPRDLIDEKLIHKHVLVPLTLRGHVLYVATSNPTNTEALDVIRFHTKYSIEAIIVEHDKLKRFIEQHFSIDYIFDFEEEFHLEGEFEQQAENEDQDEPSDPSNEAPLVKYIHKLLIDAIRMGASDLHFEPYEKYYRVRYRIDGVLRQIATPPVQLANRIASRLKVMSQMDIAEKRAPQDGRIKFRLSKNRAIDFRVNALPTLFGEKLVLRILDPSSAFLGIDALGYEPDQQTLFMQALEKPQGMILITGPTGSGKTVSLYTGLHLLNTESANISTAEDPVEINLEGINQVNVNPKVGLTFAAALKSFLRQDPDIIMVGEIRDLETAEIAIKAAQTGHMVMSTLHTNSAPETLMRLRNMGVPSFNIATSVNLVIAQRLARRLCPFCKLAVDIPNCSLLEMGFTEQDLITKNFIIYQPVGCEECRDGYKGRVGIYEVMKVTPAISKIIMQDGNAHEIAAASKLEGFDDLRRAGLKKVMQGVTSLQEISRITNE